MYSRAPTPKESSIIKTANAKINRSLGQKKVLVQPFSQPVEEQSEQDSEDEPAPPDHSQQDNYEDKDPPLPKRQKSANNNKPQLDVPSAKRKSLTNKKNHSDDEDVPLAKRNKVTNNNKQQLGKDVTLAKRKSLTNKSKPKPVCNRKMKIQKKQDEDQLIQGVEATVQEEEDVLINEYLPLDQSAKQRWKGWKLVPVSEMVSNDANDEIQEDEDGSQEANGSIRKSKRIPKRKRV
ncbi:uncharacterized protein MELLADRAFT_71663 [Melampsora larici-populina 98AG31]|uniref:Uncharacterized protein n=1 Tax=Melampsora larici-populina (strain 98AG31 / pathotype 3-4-7) TaxID=747676 RepID=F4RJ59_MELLP|nr:uncharacterized protein MELLADRAFT_71663 [Melampsora larici-populina 98AG31]EGG07709.1 hypothetical protein MELLADRAFT_71663 [Melampsora larici-populina 98AG31]